MILITGPDPHSGQATANKSVTIRIGDVVATQKLQQHFAQTALGIISSEQRTKRAPIGRRGYEEWRQVLEEYWQRQLETLQKYVRETLLRHQQLSMALPANEPGLGHDDAINFPHRPGASDLMPSQMWMLPVLLPPSAKPMVKQQPRVPARRRLAASAIKLSSNGSDVRRIHLTTQKGETR
jgi:hypothetical protein